MPTMRDGGYDHVNGRRSSMWFDRDGLDGFLHRSWLKSSGVDDESFRGRPLIGICNSWSELVNCNVHLRGLAEAVKRGVLQAGGFPREFPVMSLGESLMKPTTMLYRNLMAMDVEESIRAYPLDGVVLLTGCDKTNPAAILGACSADVPAIVVTGGPMLNGHWRGRGHRLLLGLLALPRGAARGTHHRRGVRRDRERDVPLEWPLHDDGNRLDDGMRHRGARVDAPGGAAIPAVDARRSQLAEAAGRQIVELAERQIKPSDILTRGAFENAIRALHAISGSTNAILHLIAYAGRARNRPAALAVRRAVRVDAVARGPEARRRAPHGRLLLRGGLPAVLHQIRDLLDLDTLTVTGLTLGENLDRISTQIVDDGVIRLGRIRSTRAARSPCCAAICVPTAP